MDDQIPSKKPQRHVRVSLYQGVPPESGNIEHNPKWELTPKRQAALRRLIELGVSVRSDAGSANYVLHVPLDLITPMYVEIGYLTAQLEDAHYPDGSCPLSDIPSGVYGECWPRPPTEFTSGDAQWMYYRVYPHDEWQPAPHPTVVSASGLQISESDRIAYNPRWNLTPKRAQALGRLAELGVSVNSSADCDNYVLWIPHGTEPAVYFEAGYLMAQLGNENFPEGYCILSDIRSRFLKSRMRHPSVEFAESYPGALKYRVEAE